MMAESESGEHHEHAQAPGIIRGGKSKGVFRQRFIQTYEQFFKGEDPSKGQATFWEELFLLKINLEYFDTTFGSMGEEQLLSLKDTINHIIRECIVMLSNENEIRVAHALMTLGSFFQNIFKKKLSSHGFDPLIILFGGLTVTAHHHHHHHHHPAHQPVTSAAAPAQGFATAQEVIRSLIFGLQGIIAQTLALLLRELAMRVLQIILTAYENVSQNGLVEYLMQYSIFDCLIELFRSKDTRHHHGKDALALLAILINYRKYETPNPYRDGIADLKDEILLTGMGAVMLDVFSERNRKWTEDVPPPTKGWFKSVTDMFGSMFVNEEDMSGMPRASAVSCGGVLLALYEIVNLNGAFVNVLTHTQVLTEDGENTTPVAAAPDASLALSVDQTNVLSTYLTFASFILQDSKDSTSQLFSRLCLVTLVCITEDAHANAFLHDVNVKVSMVLHRAAMRHRPASTELLAPSCPAVFILDLNIEFLVSHLRRTLEHDLYAKSLGIIHRLLCYQRHQRVRLSYKWKELWAALVGLLKFLTANEKSLDPACNIYSLSNMVVNIFNLFITYGDTFLPDPNSYDELYYELIREHKIYENLFDAAKSHVRSGGPHHVAANKATTNLFNIRAITEHFNPRIEQWTASNPHVQLQPDHVLTIVRDNYDTLTLKLQDHLDSYEKFNENPSELPFFTHITRAVVQANKSVQLFVEPIVALPKQ